MLRLDIRYSWYQTTTPQYLKIYSLIWFCCLHQFLYDTGPLFLTLKWLMDGVSKYSLLFVFFYPWILIYFWLVYLIPTDILLLYMSLWFSGYGPFITYVRNWREEGDHSKCVHLRASRGYYASCTCTLTLSLFIFFEAYLSFGVSYYL